MHIVATLQSPSLLAFCVSLFEVFEKDAPETAPEGRRDARSNRRLRIATTRVERRSPSAQRAERGRAGHRPARSIAHWTEADGAAFPPRF